MTEKPTTAVLFDIDGTLVDSNYAHIDAWWRACRTAGQPVDAWRIHRLIGMDSAMLMEELLGSSDSDVAKSAKEYHTAYYAEQQPLLHVLPGARELLAEVARRGHAVVLATSAPESELKVLRELLDVEDVLTAVTSAEDVSSAKPDPGIIKVALDRVGVDPSNAVMIGDAMWDVESSGKVGVTCIAVHSGGIGADELTASGAAAVYDDAAALLAAIDDSPIAKLGR
jgi:HAD superfamily hydrolase (TIGR01509 family)